jgi:hypothetical protein
VKQLDGHAQCSPVIILLTAFVTAETDSQNVIMKFFFVMRKERQGRP